MEEGSGGAQRECDSNGVERERDAVRLDLLQKASVDQRMHIRMDGFHIAFDPPCDITDTKWPFPGHGLEHFPSLGRDDLPQQFARGEADSGSLALP